VLGRKGVSELVAAATLIAIVLIASIVYYNYFMSQQQVSIAGFIDVARMSRERQMEMLSLIYFHKDVDGSTTVTMYVYNYGFVDVEIDRIFINNAPASFSIYDSTGNNVDKLYRNDLYKVIATVPKKFNGRLEVTIVTGRNKIYSYNIPP